MYEDTIKFLKELANQNELIHGDPAQPALDRLEKAATLHEKILKENRIQHKEMTMPKTDWTYYGMIVFVSVVVSVALLALLQALMMFVVG